MDNKFRTSFVPKKTTTTMSSSSSVIGLGTLVGLIVLGTSLVVFAGAFGYQYYLLDAINRPCGGDSGGECGLKESLAREKRALDVAQVTRLANLDAKMKTAQTIINNHTSLAPLLTLLEEYTLHNIKFTSMEYEENVLTLNGVARNYEDIAVQAATFRTNKMIKSASFSDFETLDTGEVSFEVALSIDGSRLKYNSNNN